MQFSSAATAQRSRVLIVLVALAALLVPVALAWACGPNRAFQLSHSSCEPGCTMTASGANYPAGSTLQLSLEPGGRVGTVTVPGSGSFSISFTAPRAPGSYVVLLQGFDANGDYVAGTPARQSFSVVAPAPAPAPTPTPTPTQEPAAPAAEAPPPAAASGQAPAAAAPAQPAAPQGAGAAPTASAQTSGRTSRRPAPRSTAGVRSDGSRSSAGRGAGAGSGTGAASRPAVGRTGIAAEPVGVISRSGEQVFAGSISRSERTTSNARTGSTSATAPSGGVDRPSPTTANADVWSGFSPSDGPSLLPQAGAVDAPSIGRPESGLLYGVLLLGVGSLALVGGLAIAAARRRRT